MTYIPEQVLNHVMRGTEKTLRSFLNEEVQEPIVFANWKLLKDQLEIFTAQTENNTIKLIFGSEEDFLLIIPRK